MDTANGLFFTPNLRGPSLTPPPAARRLPPISQPRPVSRPRPRFPPPFAENPRALLAAGDHYFYGMGVPVDYARAVALYTQASDSFESARAAFNLGYIYHSGTGPYRQVRSCAAACRAAAPAHPP